MSGEMWAGFFVGLFLGAVIVGAWSEMEAHKRFDETWRDAQKALLNELGLLKKRK